MQRKSPVVRRLDDGSLAVYYTLVGTDGALESGGRLIFRPGDPDFEFWNSMISMNADREPG